MAASSLLVESMALVLYVAGPALLASALIGLAVGLMSAATRVQDPALAMVPRLAGVALVIAVLGGWMGGEVLRFTSALWLAIPTLVR